MRCALGRFMQPVVMTHKKMGLLAARGARQLGRLFEMTPVRLDVMLRLELGPARQHDLGMEMGVIHSVISRLVKALLDRGLVTREVWEHDHRHRLITLTDAGRKLIRGLYDGFLADDGTASIQATCELELNDEYAALLEKEGLRSSYPSLDHRELANRLYYAVDRVPRGDYFDWLRDAKDPLPVPWVPPASCPWPAALPNARRWRLRRSRGRPFE